MKPIQSTFRRLMPLLGIAALASVLPISVQAQTQNVTVNGQVVCTGSSPGMQIDPAGNLSITCTPAGGGSTTPTAPSCVVPPVTVTQGAAAMATVTASCSGSPTSYAWTAGTGAPFPATAPTTQSFSAGPFPNLGTFTYSVVATNAVGPSASAQGTVTVVAPGTCTASASAVTATLNGSSAQPHAAIPKLGFVSYAIPPQTVAGKILSFSTTQDLNNPGPNPLPTEFAISACPGDFVNTVAGCPARYGYDFTGSTQMVATSGTAIAGTKSGCMLALNTQYYLNVRNVDQQNNPVCRAATCYEIITFNSN